MDAPTRVLKTINHEEPDRVPAFERSETAIDPASLNTGGMDYYTIRVVIGPIWVSSP